MAAAPPLHAAAAAIVDDVACRACAEARLAAESGGGMQHVELHGGTCAQCGVNQAWCAHGASEALHHHTLHAALSAGPRGMTGMALRRAFRAAPSHATVSGG